MPGGDPATLSIETGGVYTLTAAMYEDGLRLDRLLLTPTNPYPYHQQKNPTTSKRTGFFLVYKSH